MSKTHIDTDFLVCKNKREKMIVRRGYCNEKGAFAIMAAPLLLLIIILCGVALGISQIYNRKVDLSGFVKVVALAAARELNGTSAGVASARSKAREAASHLRYQYFNDGVSFSWDDNALTFSKGSARSGTWVDGTSPSGLYFAKVDTSNLDLKIGNVTPIFGSVFPNSSTTVHVDDSAVAGRKKIYVVPLAVCAMDNAMATARVNSGASATELVQYGFRRGISYDLMQLNPNGTKPVSYLINPVIAPGVYSSTFNTALSGPFVCTGNMWVPGLSGGTVRTSPLPDTSPLTGMYSQLNTRFDNFSGSLCSPFGGPPDYNVKAFDYTSSGGVSWMVPNIGSSSAISTTSRGKLETIADLPSPPAGTSAGSYGPLWVFSKAVKYPSYAAIGAPEPDSGYANFATTEWTSLYKLGPTVSSYPTVTPYNALSGANYKSPSAANLDLSTSNRRLLNIPLLSCPLASGYNVPATVLGIAKFFMTIPATQNTLVAEFAGVLSDQSIPAEVQLYP